MTTTNAVPYMLANDGRPMLEHMTNSGLLLAPPEPA